MLQYVSLVLVPPVQIERKLLPLPKYNWWEELTSYGRSKLQRGKGVNRIVFVVKMGEREDHLGGS